jgi:hypothetical protein
MRDPFAAVSTYRAVRQSERAVIGDAATAKVEVVVADHYAVGQRESGTEVDENAATTTAENAAGDCYAGDGHSLSCVNCENSEVRSSASWVAPDCKRTSSWTINAQVAIDVRQRTIKRDNRWQSHLEPNGIGAHRGVSVDDCLSQATGAAVVGIRDHDALHFQRSNVHCGGAIAVGIDRSVETGAALIGGER